VLSSKYRLRQDWLIRKLLRSTSKYNYSDFVILWDNSINSDPQFAFIASKKIGSAVKRNRVTRLLRESIRILIKENFKIPAHRYVLIARVALLNQTQVGVNEIFRRFFMDFA